MNKRKIFNDPVYGFITIPYEIVFDVIEHPYFQRLRRIQQLGMSSLVYPGATHTRFHHSLGAMHLMHRSLEVLKSKGIQITEQESQAAILAILLHDLGHGPFSHALEGILLKKYHHEDISILLMDRLKMIATEPIEMAIAIFKNTYPKKFLHQLVSGQLDMDRMDYLNRDSFYTGVSEGVIGYDRIINMLHVHNDNIVVEEKGIYSIEKFLVARRLMYWQVYLHKTSLVADLMLKNAFLRAKKILQNGQKIGNIPTCLLALLTENYKGENELLSLFTQVDDADAICSLKSFMSHDDEILKRLSSGLINRVLFKIEFLPEKIADEKYNQISPQFNEDERSYFLLNGEVMNNAYNPKKENIFILFKDGSIRDIAEIAEQMNIRSLSNEVVKYYLAYPENNLVLN